MLMTWRILSLGPTTEADATTVPRAHHPQADQASRLSEPQLTSVPDAREGFGSKVPKVPVLATRPYAVFLSERHRQSGMGSIKQV